MKNIMNGFMDWLSNSFAPTMNRFAQKPWIATLSSAMQKIIPFILTGSIIHLYNVVRSYVPALPDLSWIIKFSFGMLGLLTAFMVANQAMEKLGHTKYTINAGLTAVSVFIMYIKPVIDQDGIFSVGFNRFGPTGIIVGIVAGYIVSVIFNFVGKRELLSESNLPDFVIGWVQNIVPIFTCIGLSVFMVFKLDIDLFALILQLFSPIQGFGQTLPGFVLLIFLMTFFYTLGISHWLWNGVKTPIFMAGIAANIAAVEAGLPAVNIATNEAVFTAGLITMGGMGATLTLNILMCFSKSKDLKTLGRMTLVPSIFNINEPIMYSAPVVMNPLLMVPTWINSIVGPVVIWISMRGGFLNIPSKMIQVGQIPAPISSIMITEDFRAVFVYIFLFLLYLAIWYPFFKIYEKQKIQEEVLEMKEAINE
ncbi:PTS sugar transporter subunit IIC [Lacrimispora sp.]|uniref:PTS sugar transporter subunit IIC n=1 Tax=Lacrimispora sp. TaxID=2719234 RepID=UPI002FD99274